MTTIYHVMQSAIGCIGTDQSFLAKNVALQTYGRFCDGMWSQRMLVVSNICGFYSEKQG